MQAGPWVEKRISSSGSSGVKNIWNIWKTHKVHVKYMENTLCYSSLSWKLSPPLPPVGQMLEPPLGRDLMWDPKGSYLEMTVCRNGEGGVIMRLNTVPHGVGGHSSQLYRKAIANFRSAQRSNIVSSITGRRHSDMRKERGSSKGESDQVIPCATCCTQEYGKQNNQNRRPPIWTRANGIRVLCILQKICAILQWDLTIERDFSRMKNDVLNVETIGKCFCV